MAAQADVASRRVLIVGGSISGLTLAVALQSAGIDFLVLESREIGPQLGASTGIHPFGQNILHQLGVYEHIIKLGIPFTAARTFDDYGNYIERDINVLARHTERYGFPLIFIQRYELIHSLYERIIDKSKVMTHKKVVGYEDDGYKVIVTTEDGSSYEGTILVGADGIHSTVRKLMRKTADGKSMGAGASLETTDGGKPGFSTEYRCLFGISKSSDTVCTMPPGCTYWSYGDNYSTTAASGQDGKIFWFLWESIDKVQSIESPRYTEEDARNLAEKFRGKKMCKQFTVGDAWDARIRANLFAQEEGILDQWSFGRTVLIGDAVHKMSANAGLGAMTAFEGIVHFVNNLVPALSPGQSENYPSLSEETCHQIFSAYRREHMPRAKKLVDASKDSLRMEARASLYWRILSTYILPMFSNVVRQYLMDKLVVNAPSFNHIPLDRTRPMNKKRL